MLSPPSEPGSELTKLLALRKAQAPPAPVWNHGTRGRPAKHDEPPQETDGY
jgi:hypothetical protein